MELSFDFQDEGFDNIVIENETNSGQGKTNIWNSEEVKRWKEIFEKKTKCVL